MAVAVNDSDLTLPGYNKPASLISLKSYVVPETMSQESYLETEIIFRIDSFPLSKSFVSILKQLSWEMISISRVNPAERWYDKQFLDEQLTDVRFVATGELHQTAGAGEHPSWWQALAV